jgi:hypothetical protein
LLCVGRGLATRRGVLSNVENVSKDAKNSPEMPKLRVDYNACAVIGTVVVHKATFAFISSVYPHVIVDKTHIALVLNNYVVSYIYYQTINHCLYIRHNVSCIATMA